ncbi:MAG: competence/damage-inducible protein A, partial [Gemmatimonadaceae bacterium]|nr:competence/damage-inducible protein A [Gemmatimonadaceae bacterium]
MTLLRIELVTIGDELLLGYTIDSNAAYIARTLAEIGVQVVRRATVGDDVDAIAAALRDALDRTGAVITTGGLGPTADDRTRTAIASVFGRILRRDDVLVARMEERFRALGRPMPPNNVVQAMVPEGARVLQNRHGTAPGLWLEDARGRWVAVLPGVPREMRGMVNDTLLPILRERAGADGAVVLSRTLRTTGIGESALAELLGPDGGDTVDGVPLAYLPGWAGVDLRLTVRGLPHDQATHTLDHAAAKLYARAGRYIYGEGDADLADVVLALCRARGLHIATAESCTGGMLGARITAIPGSSDVYVGGVVAYDNRIKEQLLDVPAELLRTEGAVSEAVAKRMASGVCARLGTEIGVAITGIAGPGGGTPEKPVGTVWTAVHVDGAAHAVGRRYVGDREEIRQRSAQAALDMIRR